MILISLDMSMRVTLSATIFSQAPCSMGLFSSSKMVNSEMRQKSMVGRVVGMQGRTQRRTRFAIELSFLSSKIWRQTIFMLKLRKSQLPQDYTCVWQSSKWRWRYGWRWWGIRRWQTGSGSWIPGTARTLIGLPPDQSAPRSLQYLGEEKYLPDFYYKWFTLPISLT